MCNVHERILNVNEFIPWPGSHVVDVFMDTKRAYESIISLLHFKNMRSVGSITAYRIDSSAISAILRKSRLKTTVAKYLILMHLWFGSSLSIYFHIFKADRISSCLLWHLFRVANVVAVILPIFTSRTTIGIMSVIDSKFTHSFVCTLLVHSFPLSLCFFFSVALLLFNAADKRPAFLLMSNCRLCHCNLLYRCEREIWKINLNWNKIDFSRAFRFIFLPSWLRQDDSTNRTKEYLHKSGWAVNKLVLFFELKGRLDCLFYMWDVRARLLYV